MRYGARLTHRWKGRLFTALATAGLLAMSAGTALAQVTVTGPAGNKVAEGGTATYNIAVKGYAAPSAPAGTVTVTLVVTAGTAGDGATAGELDGDISTTNFGLTYTVTVPANSSTTAKRAFSSTGSIVVPTLHDADAEDENFTLAFTASDVGGLQVGSADDTEGNAAIALVTTGGSTAPTALTIDDDETQTYVLELAPNQDLTEGDVATVNLKAVPEHDNVSLALTLHTSDAVNYLWDNDADFSDRATDPPPATIAVGPDDATVPAAGLGNSVSVYVKAPDNDKNRVTDTVTLTAFSGSAGSATEEASLDISFADDHVLAPAEAVTAVAMDKKTGGMEVDSVTEGGDPVYLTISVDRGKASDKDATTIEELTVDVKVAAANAADVNVTPTRVELGEVTTANGEQKSTMVVELSALADEDVGNEMLTLHLEMMGQDANGSGSSTGTFTIAIEDATDTKIAAKSEGEAYPSITSAIEAGAGDDQKLNPGETVEISTDDLFTVESGYTASYGVSVEGEAVSASASGDTVTINAVVAGEAMVTVTGTAQAVGSSFSSSQSISNVAEVTFPVTVVNETLVVMLTADPMAIDEGGTSTITAMANRAVVAGDGAVAINLTVVGDATLAAESITIAMGAMSGSTMLTATEDDADYADETVTVVASGSGIDGQTSVEIAVTDNDEAPVAPEPENVIQPKAQDDAYPVITDAIEAAAGDEGLNPGESFELAASDLFDLAIGYTAAYAVTVEGTAVSAAASGDTVSVTAEMAGEATVTITGTARAASSSFEASQTSTHTAEVKFPVTVVDKALVVTLELPANAAHGNVVEGSSYDIVVSANRAVHADTVVTIMRDRAQSAAGDSDYTVGSATIMAGYDSATAELMVAADDLSEGGTEDGGNVGESLVLFGVVNGEQTNDLTFTIWDVAVPALPFIATWLLGLGLLGGGARQMYLRRRQD